MQLSPARGRLRFCQSPCVMLCVDAAYPREGTVTSSGKSGRSPVAGYSLAPRGDGYALFLELHSNFKIQLSPARGRLLHLSRILYMEKRCNLSPQGDGYRTRERHLSKPCSMQLSPARGRLLHCADGNVTLVIRCSLAPRGDGYEELIEPRCIVNRYSLAPRGDGYLTFVRLYTPTLGCNLAPRGDGYLMMNFG